MQIIVSHAGSLSYIYDETLDLAALGPVSIRRASQVEPDSQGQWFADLAPVGGPLLGPFGKRSEALAAELSWLEAHWPDSD